MYLHIAIKYNNQDIFEEHVVYRFQFALALS